MTYQPNQTYRPDLVDRPDVATVDRFARALWLADDAERTLYFDYAKAPTDPVELCEALAIHANRHHWREVNDRAHRDSLHYTLCACGSGRLIKECHK